MIRDDATDPDAIPRDEVERILGGRARAATPLGHSTLGPTRGVWRVHGAGEDSAILKVVGPRRDDGAAASERPSSYHFWGRELAILGGAGLPPSYLHAGLRAPRLLGRFERPDGGVAMWLEIAPGRSGAELTIDDFRDVARRLGRAQAPIELTDRSDWSWRSRGFLRTYAENRPVDVGSRWRLEPDDERWERPAMAVVDVALRDGLIALQRERERFLGWVESAPQTIAHLDVWPANIFAPLTPGDDTVLIDWAFAGDGALGEDIGNLVPDAVFDHMHPVSILAELDSAVSDAYLAGAREAGWTGDEREIRLAMCASAVKYDWIAAGMLARSDEPDQRIYGRQDAVPTAEHFAIRSAVLRHLVAWADEARRLAAELGRA